MLAPRFKSKKAILQVTWRPSYLKPRKAPAMKTKSTVSQPLLPQQLPKCSRLCRFPVDFSDPLNIIALIYGSKTQSSLLLTPCCCSRWAPSQVFAVCDSTRVGSVVGCWKQPCGMDQRPVLLLGCLAYHFPL